MRISVADWLETFNMDIDDISYVMCVDDGYKPHYGTGEYYKVLTKGIKAPTYTISKMDSDAINKLFIPIQGTPTNLTLRDKLLINIRTNKCYTKFIK